MEKPCASPLRYFRMLKQQMHFFLSLKGCGMAATLQATKVAGLPPAVILFLDFLSTSGVNFEILWLKDVESSSSSNMVNLRHPKTQKKKQVIFGCHSSFSNETHHRTNLFSKVYPDGFNQIHQGSLNKDLPSNHGWDHNWDHRMGVFFGWHSSNIRLERYRANFR